MGGCSDCRVSVASRACLRKGPGLALSLHMRDRSDLAESSTSKRVSWEEQVAPTDECSPKPASVHQLAALRQQELPNRGILGQPRSPGVIRRGLAVAAEEGKDMRPRRPIWLVLDGREVA